MKNKYKVELIAEVAAALHSFGYQVYLADSKDYGFYTDGSRVVSFGGHWNLSVDFSGNYRALTAEGGRRMGTGWQMEDGKELGSITRYDAERFIKAGAPVWATGGDKFAYTTPEEHLKTYGQSSRYTLYTGTTE